MESNQSTNLTEWQLQELLTREKTKYVQTLARLDILYGEYVDKLMKMKVHVLESIEKNFHAKKDDIEDKIEWLYSKIPNNNENNQNHLQNHHQLDTACDELGPMSAKKYPSYLKCNWCDMKFQTEEDALQHLDTMHPLPAPTVTNSEGAAPPAPPAPTDFDTDAPANWHKNENRNKNKNSEGCDGSDVGASGSLDANIDCNDEKSHGREDASDASKALDGVDGIANETNETNEMNDTDMMDVMERDKNIENEKNGKNGKNCDARRCDECDKMFASVKEMCEHKTRHLVERPFECNVCKRRYRTKEKMDSHVKRKHGAQNKSVEPVELADLVEKEKRHCDVSETNQSFGSRKMFSGHKNAHKTKQTNKTKHAKRLKSPPEERKHRKHGKHAKHENRCKICKHKFETDSESEKHMKEQHIEKSYKCSECDNIFGTKAELASHRHIHVKEWKCNECSRSFPGLQYLTRHKKSHYKKEKFSCIDCDFKCGTESEMDHHMQQLH